MLEAAHRGRLKITFGGIVFIYDEVEEREVTLFLSRDLTSDESGTKVVPPVILQKNEAYMSSKYLTMHDCNQRHIMADHKLWTGHSVFVVDMSGSMDVMMLVVESVAPMPYGWFRPKTLCIRSSNAMLLQDGMLSA